METIITFDARQANRMRRELTRRLYREGRDYRIGMAEEAGRLTLRAPDGAGQAFLAQCAREILEG